MKANIDQIDSPLSGPVRSLTQNSWRRLMPCRRSPFLVALVAVLGAQMALAETALAQSTVYIGGQGTPGITINLSAIYGGASPSSVAPVPYLQSDLAGRLGDRRLQFQICG